MTVEDMKNKKKELGLSNQIISTKSGIPVNTLQRIFSGKTGSPRRDTLLAIEKAFLSIMKSDHPSQPASSVKEAEAAYRVKRQGEFTVEDYYAIPDERRVELIDGVIYDMAAPSSIHQAILGELHLQFRACADAHGEGCDVYFAPCDVRLDNDNKTMLQPDLFVLCHEYDHQSHCINGAPDLTLEILSHSTRSRDSLLKLYKYSNAGVKEFWIVDPESREVYVYDFAKSGFEPDVYSFESRIPIHLSGDTCSVDFAKISKRIAPFYPQISSPSDPRH